VVPDFRFRSFLASDPDRTEVFEVEYTRELVKCSPMLQAWRPLRLFAESPRLKMGNFARSWGGGFLLDARARSVMSPLLDSTVEFLPFLPYEGEVLHLLNVLECVDCLDEVRTKYVTDKETGAKLAEILEYHFLPERLSWPPLFRLPKRSALFALTRHASIKEEFKAVFEREGLTGLKFEKLWSDGK